MSCKLYANLQSSNKWYALLMGIWIALIEFKQGVE